MADEHVGRGRQGIMGEKLSATKAVEKGRKGRKEKALIPSREN